MSNKLALPSWLPSYPYPPAREDGYWAPITSTLDWCEENYYATPYSAEIVNTLTNLFFIYLAFKGMYNCYTQGHDRIFFITFAGCVLVASGSFAFHATLKYPMQLVDELSMIYTTCLMFWATFSHKQSRTVQTLIAVAVAALALFITLYYHFLQDPTFHQTAYALLTAIVLLRSMWIMEMRIRPYFRKQKEDLHKKSLTPLEEDRQDVRDRAILRKMWALVATGLFVFLGGFAIWNLDNAFCSKLRAWRYEVGLPWGILLEGHGWWHIGTGLGAYMYIVWGVWLRHCLNGRHDEFECVWPGLLTSIPQIVRRDGVAAKKNL